MATTMTKKRANIVLPPELYDALKVAADERHTTVNGLLRSFIKLGLLVIEYEKSSDAALIIKEGEREREIMLL